MPTLGRDGSPHIAVIIPAYNAETTIAAAVSSALREPETCEVVVVDDGSRDATGEAARSADDGSGRLRVVRQPNGGVSAACNAGVALTTAPIWTVLDADDVFARGRFAALLARVGDAWDIAADPVVFRAPDGSEHRLEPRSGFELITLETFVRGNISRRKAPRSELGYLQPLKRRAFFDRHRLSFDPAVRFAEDYMFYATALARGARFVWGSGPGYVAYVRAGSLSHTQSAADYERVIAFDEALMAGRSRDEVAALREHAALMRLKERYRRVEDAVERGSWTQAMRITLSHPRTTGYVFNHRWRPGLSRRVKRFAAQRPPRDLFAPGE
jgi:succinoglycan biosynthesis protein ExoU